MWKKPADGWLLSSLGGFPVTRGTADREALKRCIAVLEAGEPLVLFPEGERKSGPVVQPLFDGAVYVALKAGVPIVPGRHRRLRAGDAEGREVHLPAQGARRSSAPPITPPPAADGGRVPREPSMPRRRPRELHAELQGCSTRRRRSVGAADGGVRREVGGERGGELGGSAAPHSSRAECIDSWGTPTSTVAMPRRVAVIGPIVEPHGMLLRDTNTWYGTPAASHACWNSAAVSADVA